MLVIGHRGAAGIAAENTMAALQAGVEAGADILEFDIRLTKDKVPILVHDFHTLRTHRKASIISRLTLAELRDRSKKHPIVTLEEVLDAYFGVVMLNIELKSKSVARAAVQMIAEKYVKQSSDWDNVLFSSFSVRELGIIRRASPRANLSLLHGQNPFLFIAFYRPLQLSAVGFHRLYINPLALEIAKRAELFTYSYTVNRPHSAYLLQLQGIDGVVTDHPDRILDVIIKNRETSSN